MYHFVYITTDLNTGKQYVGDHSTENLNDGYLGSGLYIKRAIRKSSKENFKREILELFESKQEAFDAQEKYIIEHQTLFPCGYNLSPKGGHQCPNPMSEGTKKKIGNASRNMSEEAKEKIRNSSRNRSNESLEKMSLAAKKRIREKNNFFGKKHSKETIEKLKNSDKKYTKTPEYKENMSKATSGPKNGMYGKKQSEEAKQKIRDSWKKRNQKQKKDE